MLKLEKINLDDMKIEDIVFLKETIRLLHSYLGNGPSVNLIETLIENAKNKFICKNSSSETSLLNEIETEISNIENNSVKGSFVNQDFDIFSEHSNLILNKELIFIKGIRNLILSRLKAVKKCNFYNNWKKILIFYHVNIHLIELSLSDKSLSDKLREFLNVNFTLKNNDLIRHLLRGNFKHVKRDFPELTLTLEEYENYKLNSSDSDSWESKLFLPLELKNILKGKYINFNNKTEEFLYKLDHNIKFNYTDFFIEVINSNYEPIFENLNINSSVNSWLKIICLIVNPKNSKFETFEKCFENIFYEIYNLDNLLGFEFLSFSKKCSFYFYSLVDDISLNNQNVENLIDFAIRNNFDYSKITNRYCKILLDLKDFIYLSDFIVMHNLDGIECSKEFLLFFINNFKNYCRFIKKPFSKLFRFVELMINLQNLDEENLNFLINSKYFDFFVHEISNSIISRDDLSEELSFNLIEKLFEYEKRTGVLTKGIKLKVALKLSSD